MKPVNRFVFNCPHSNRLFRHWRFSYLDDRKSISNYFESRISSSSTCCKNLRITFLKNVSANKISDCWKILSKVSLWDIFRFSGVKSNKGFWIWIGRDTYWFRFVTKWFKFVKWMRARFWCWKSVSLFHNDKSRTGKNWVKVGACEFCNLIFVWFQTDFIQVPNVTLNEVKSWFGLYLKNRMSYKKQSSIFSHIISSWNRTH